MGFKLQVRWDGRLVFRIVINVLSLAISIGLAYFAVRLMLIFRGGRMEVPWRYISAGVLALALGSTLFSLHYLLALEGVIHPLGGVMMMVGGAFILAGLYAEYKRWTGRR